MNEWDFLYYHFMILMFCLCAFLLTVTKPMFAACTLPSSSTKWSWTNHTMLSWWSLTCLVLPSKPNQRTRVITWSSWRFSQRDLTGFSWLEEVVGRSSLSILKWCFTLWQKMSIKTLVYVIYYNFTVEHFLNMCWLFCRFEFENKKIMYFF